MKRLLYITPYFPPNSRVGALRPLKFIRHLGDFDWQVTVWADFRKNYGIHKRLEEFIPKEVQVIRTYSAKGISEWNLQTNHETEDAPEIKNTSAGSNRYWHNPELIPFGEHLFDIPHALKTGRELISEHKFDAILANIDPYAAGWVAMKLGKEFDIPVVADFRDPWSVCELRRPLRPAPIRWLTDVLERKVVQSCASVILNTETTMNHYRQHYADLPPEKFHFIRNTHDRALLYQRDKVVFPAKHNILFLGNFRRFLDGREAFEILAELKSRGYSPQEINLVVCGNTTEESNDIAKELNVSEYIHAIPSVTYSEILPVMQGADVLLIIANKTVQRLPSKLFDYAASDKPILCMTTAPELAQEVNDNFGFACDFTDTTKAADFVLKIISEQISDLKPRHDRYSAKRAASELALILKSSCNTK